MSIATYPPLSAAQCRSARLSRDRRFDGQFYVAVKTTGIFCRPICPATPPKESNVEYFPSQALALQAGYRPCLRCRPDSLPGSWAWIGTDTTLQKAVRLIEQGTLQQMNLATFSEKLGISDRYLRKLFMSKLGVSPKQYAQYNQLMFAKQLLHNSTMSIGDIAIASGFNSIRRFNDAFLKTLKLTPRAVRKESPACAPVDQLQLACRPPFNWKHMLDFYRLRAIDGVEKVGDNYYQRTFTLADTNGWFRASTGDRNALIIDFKIDDITLLRQLVAQIRRVFDLDADSSVIEKYLAKTTGKLNHKTGIRIPGVWNTWEAGIRAILGQQISVKAAITQLNTFVSELGERNGEAMYFPTAKSVATSDLRFLRMPQSRKDTVKRFADYMIDHSDEHPGQWIALKGIGPWTINYARLRGLSEPDCFLASDLVVKKATAQFEIINEHSTSPWGSYATFHCWDSLS